MKRSDSILLYDILECCDRIASYIEGVSRSPFDENHQLQDALVRNLEIIGEATKGLSAAIIDRDAEVPWDKMAKMRDRMVHQYFRVDLDVVWKTVTVDIPQLRSQIEPIYAEISSAERE